MSYKEASDEAIELKADAERYAYIKALLAQSTSLHMDGTRQFRLNSPRGRGRSFDEVIDNLRKEGNR